MLDFRNKPKEVHLFVTCECGNMCELTATSAESRTP